MHGPDRGEVQQDEAGRRPCDAACQDADEDAVIELGERACQRREQACHIPRAVRFEPLLSFADADFVTLGNVTGNRTPLRSKIVGASGGPI